MSLSLEEIGRSLLADLAPVLALDIGPTLGAEAFHWPAVELPHLKGQADFFAVYHNLYTIEGLPLLDEVPPAATDKQ